MGLALFASGNSKAGVRVNERVQTPVSQLFLTSNLFLLSQANVVKTVRPNESIAAYRAKPAAADPAPISLDYVNFIEGPPKPPELVAGLVDRWPLLHRVVVESLVTSQRLRWKDVTVQLAEQLCGTTLYPLETLMQQRWEWLPPQPNLHNFIFTANVSVSCGRVSWELQWPQVVSRKFAAGCTGYSKRMFEYHGHTNLLFVELPGGNSGVRIAERLFQCRPSSETVLHLLGHEWKLLFCRPDSAKCQMVFKRAGSTIGRHDGVFDRWHFDPSQNGHITVAKALSRCNLASSTVVATVQVQKTSIIPAENSHLDPLTDGACGISRSLFVKVWECFCAATSTDDTGTSPTVFQGRIGPMKGVWYIDPSLPDGTMQVRSTQKKFELPDPTPQQLRIEVCCFGVDSGPARLNLQMIRLLEMRMADPQLLVELLTQQLADCIAAFKRFEKAEAFCRDAGSIGVDIMAKLQNGFKLDHVLVQSLLRKAMHSKHQWCVDENKLHIRLPKSRDLIIIPDPFSVLRPHEVIVKIPGIGYVQNQNVIVARNPCYDPGELLELTAIHAWDLLQRVPISARGTLREWFETQQCVAVLSSQGAGSNVHTDGERSVADMMQGGDYDGDRVKVIYDRRFTDGLRSFDPPQYSPSVKHPLGSVRLADVDSHDDAAFEWFKYLVSNQGRNLVGQISVLVSCAPVFCRHLLPKSRLTPLCISTTAGLVPQRETGIL